MSFRRIRIPTAGEKGTVRNGKLQVPDQPIIGDVGGSGIAPDNTPACLRIRDAAVANVYVGTRKIHW
ncbi:MAG: hypothetical protein ACT4QA_20760 [Panacagrimonas sp.]